MRLNRKQKKRAERISSFALILLQMFIHRKGSDFTVFEFVTQLFTVKIRI